MSLIHTSERHVIVIVAALVERDEQVGAGVAVGQGEAGGGHFGAGGFYNDIDVRKTGEGWMGRGTNGFSGRPRPHRLRRGRRRILWIRLSPLCLLPRYAPIRRSGSGLVEVLLLRV